MPTEKDVWKDQYGTWRRGHGEWFDSHDHFQRGRPTFVPPKRRLFDNDETYMDLYEDELKMHEFDLAAHGAWLYRPGGVESRKAKRDFHKTMLELRKSSE